MAWVDVFFFIGKAELKYGHTEGNVKTTGGNPWCGKKYSKPKKSPDDDHIF